MESVEATPPEHSAGAVANILFDALRRGDYSAAARAREAGPTGVVSHQETTRSPEAVSPKRG